MPFALHQPSRQLQELLDSPKTLAMGILNITPDSFSDGGALASINAVLQRAEEMLSLGVDILDVGGESTRPQAAEVPADEEINRVLPVIEAISKRFPQAIISVDTRKAKVAHLALQYGATMVNDVSGLTFDADMMDVVSSAKAYVVIMHSVGTPQTMQQNPHYNNVTEDVADFLMRQAAKALYNGVPKNRIIIDPGLGFGKTVEHNVTLMKKLADITQLGYPVLLGASRKSFLTLGDDTIAATDREALTAATTALGVKAGVKIVRIHHPEQQLPVLRLVDKILGGYGR